MAPSPPDTDDDVRRPRATVLRHLQALYRKADEAYAEHGCPGTAECCRLAMSKREPWLHAPEWWALEEQLRKDGRTLPPPREDGACPFLDARGARCTVYAARPFGCRTFFCHRRTGPASEPLAKMDALNRQLSALAAEASDDAEPRPLRAWWEAARR